MIHMDTNALLLVQHCSIIQLTHIIFIPRPTYLINRIVFYRHSNEQQQQNESSHQINDNFPHGRGKNRCNGFHQSFCS